MAEQTEVKSENARNVILSCGSGVYFVSRVNVQVREGAGRFKAVFHAVRMADHQLQELNVEISQAVYDVLVEYARMDKVDLILVLHIDGEDAKWCLMSENWLRNQPCERRGKREYVV
jgi:hypothetical protein